MRNQDSPTQRRSNSRLGFGIIILGIGVLLLLDKFNVPLLRPLFHLGWPAILLIVGVAIGFRKDWKGNAWWILILIGIANLIPRFGIESLGIDTSDIAIPLCFIIGGLIMMRHNKDNRHYRRPRGRHYQKPQFTQSEFVHNPNTAQQYDQSIVNTNAADVVDIDVTFGGRKELVTSQAFRGGKINAMFSGVELNLLQAVGEADQAIVIQISASFSGVSLLIPGHWKVINDMTASIGSVEDQRRMRSPEESSFGQTLVLRGSITCGSVEIKS